MNINWQTLAQIKELREYFEADFQGFQHKIEQYTQNLQAIDPEELDKVALIRVLEVTNGCTQWGFRRQDEHCLSVEQTRECMKVVIGFIKEQRIAFPSGESISFTPPVAQLLTEIRNLYQDAFKKNVEGAEEEYHAYSTAQFLVYGRRRMEIAMQRIQDEFESLFSPYYIQRGRNYIAPYLEALPSDAS